MHKYLKAQSEISTLKVGSRPDITVVDLVKGSWLCHNSLDKHFVAKQKLVPAWVVRSGKLIKPHCRLLRDLHLAQPQKSPMLEQFSLHLV